MVSAASTVRPERPLGQRHLFAEDAQVHRGLRARKGVEVGEVGRVRKHPDRANDEVLRRDVRVHAGEGAEGLRHTLLGFGPAGQIPDVVTRLGRLLHVDAILDEWTANLHPRVERVDSETAVTPAAQARSETVRAELPLDPGRGATG